MGCGWRVDNKLEDFADPVFAPRRNMAVLAIVVELKRDDTPEGAIAQIKEREYADFLQGRDEEVLLVGIAYDSKTKEHACIIEPG